MPKGLIADFKTKVSLLSARPSKGKDFLPNSSLEYNQSLNVYSFGYVVCHVMTQKRPVTSICAGLSGELMFQSHTEGEASSNSDTDSEDLDMDNNGI